MVAEPVTAGAEPLSAQAIPVESVQFVKELYPRLREDESAIERYRAAVDHLPPIVVARGRILVDGFHRWQAYRREGLSEIPVVDLGDLTEIEIVKESIRRNAAHGRQLETSDKKRMADRLYRQGTRDINEVAELLSITRGTAEKYTAEARQDQKAEQQARAWDLWLDCWTQQRIADELGLEQQTISNWLQKRESDSEFCNHPSSRQHFDVWNFGDAGGESNGVFGRMPAQIVENLLWLYTEPGQLVVDPFAGGGTTIDVAKRMGRRVWASDRKPSTPTLPIHAHDITTGWPSDAPARADFILLDPPYWKQAAGRYSNDPEDLGNMPLDAFMVAWGRVLEVCIPHLGPTGKLAFIISPTEDGDRVVDHAFELYAAALAAGLRPYRRIVVTYTTQRANGQQVEWAREQRKLLKLYRDLVVLTR